MMISIAGRPDARNSLLFVHLSDPAGVTRILVFCAGRYLVRDLPVVVDMRCAGQMATTDGAWRWTVSAGLCLEEERGFSIKNRLPAGVCLRVRLWRRACASVWRS